MLTQKSTTVRQSLTEPYKSQDFNELQAPLWSVIIGSFAQKQRPDSVQSSSSSVMITLTLAVTLTSAGCRNSAPRVALSEPWYETDRDLLKKAQLYEASSMSLVDDSGLFLYKAYKPWSGTGRGRINWLDSHNLADVPAWQGMLMAALAFAEATDSRDRDQELSRLARGLKAFYEVTGVPGLLGRSHMRSYKGPRLPWMDSPKARPTKYWTQGPGGSWWRNGVAKNHLNLACFGCAIPLALERKGRLRLSKGTKELLISVLLPAVRHLVAGGFRIRDAHGEFTEFGDLRPDLTLSPNYPELSGLANPFNRVLVLHMLCSAGAYDPELKALYEKHVEDWCASLGGIMDLVGEVLNKVDRSEITKPSFSDMQAYGLAVLSLTLQEQRRPILKQLNRSMVGLWRFMRYERNPSFTLPYYLIRERSARINEVVQDLRAFPLPKDKIELQLEGVDKVETEEVQPLENRPSNANYWKSSPYRKLRKAEPKPNRHPKTKAIRHFGGQDYLLAYWLGRYIQAIPKH